MKFLYILSLLFINLYSYTICANGESQCRIDKIKILDTKKFDFSDKRLTEFSALVYKDKQLYMLSDKGRLLHFELLIKNDKIQKLTFKESYSLKDKKGKRLRKKYRDSEGMDFYGKQLLISFEGKNRVESYDLYGNYCKSIKLNKKLRKNEAYESKNKGLESVAYSHLYGVITAPEKPLKKKKKHKIYSRDFVWKFDAPGAIADMKFIDTHNVMVLMKESGVFAIDVTTTILKIDLSHCINQTCKAESLARMDSRKGWHIDNFEGLAKVGDNRYLMVSDNNDSLLQKTLLVLFEIVKR